MNELYISSIFYTESDVTLETLPNTITYDDVAINCWSDQRRLCSSKEICKNGNTSLWGVVAGDHWIPVMDSPNDWIQIGK